jgi:PEGA domain
MALANVAWILASNGNRVLLIDWDLEAPGLHHYFRPFLPDPDLDSSRGVIDFVTDFVVAAMTPGMAEEGDTRWFVEYANIRRYAQSLEWDFGKGTLDFVPAGKQGRAYAQKVNSFDWGTFYTKFGGQAFLDAARDGMREKYDYVLIDSRTGVSDTSGICTVQLPDRVVVCFTLNRQSIEGAGGVARSIRSQRGDIRVLPVPTRVEDGEQRKLGLARQAARDRFAPFLEDLTGESAVTYWSEVEIPYRRFYAYEEILAVFGDEPGQVTSILAAHERLTSRITDGEVTALVPVDEVTRHDILDKLERKAPAGEVPTAATPAPSRLRVLRWVAVVLLLLAAAVASNLLLTPSGPRGPSITIASDPPGARVLVGGEEVGTTPLLSLSVEAGEHEIRLTYRFHEDWVETVRVEGAEDLGTKRLEPWGEVLLGDVDDDVAAWIEMRRAAALPPGDPVRVELRKPAYAPQRQTLHPSQGETVRLNQGKEGWAGYQASLDLSGLGPDVEVFVEDQRRKPEILSFPEARTVKVELRRPGYEPLTVRRTLALGETLRLDDPVWVPKPVRLDLSAAKKMGVKVFLLGRKLDDDEVLELEPDGSLLPFEVRRPGFQTRLVEALVEPTDEPYRLEIPEEGWIPEEIPLEVSGYDGSPVAVGVSLDLVFSCTSEEPGLRLDLSLDKGLRLDDPEGARTFQTLGSDGPRQAKARVTVLAAGTLAVAAKAIADEQVVAETKIAVVAEVPSARVTISVPDEVTAGGTIPVEVEVAARGRLPLQEAVVTLAFSEKLESAPMSLGEVVPGKPVTRRVQWQTKDGEFGEREIVATLRAENLPRPVEVRRKVRLVEAGGLVVTIEPADPSRVVMLGRRVTYMVKIRNTATVPTERIQLEIELSRGSEFVSSEGPSEAKASATLLLFGTVESIRPGGMITYHATVFPRRSEVVVLVARLNSARSEPVQAIRRDRVSDPDRPPSIFWTIVQKLSSDTAHYELTISNQGRGSASDVALEVNSLEELEFQSVNGPGASTISGGRLVFQPLKELRPGESVTYRFSLPRTETGPTRVAANLLMAELSKPLGLLETTPPRGEEVVYGAWIKQRRDELYITLEAETKKPRDLVFSIHHDPERVHLSLHIPVQFASVGRDGRIEVDSERLVEVLRKGKRATFSLRILQWMEPGLSPIELEARDAETGLVFLRRSIAVALVTQGKEFD